MRSLPRRSAIAARIIPTRRSVHRRPSKLQNASSRLWPTRAFGSHPLKERPDRQNGFPGNLLRFRRVVRAREPEMQNDRPSLVFFSIIAVSLIAAIVLIGLLIGGDVAGPKVSMNNLPP